MSPATPTRRRPVIAAAVLRTAAPWSASLLWIVLTFAALLVIAGLARAEERFQLAGDRLAIYNIAGETRFEPAAGSQVVVLVTRGGQDASQLRIDPSPNSGKPGLRVIYPSGRVIYPELGWGSNSQNKVNRDGSFGGDFQSWFSGWRLVTVSGRGSGLHAWADLRVQVPRGQTIEVHTLAGAAFVSNVDGDILFDGGSGRVIADHVRGTLRVDTGSGEVKVDGMAGDLDIDTGSGGVVVTSVKGDLLHVDTGSGGVTADDVTVDRMHIDTGSGRVDASRVSARDINLDTGSGGVRIELLSDVETLRIDTGSGGARIELPANAGAALEIDAGSGGIRCDLPMTVYEKDSGSLRGRLGDGRGRIAVDTGSGGVVIAASAARATVKRSR